MKIKSKIIILTLSIIMILPLLAFSASAATARWSIIRSAVALGEPQNDVYYTIVTATSDTTKLEVDLNLYEKGIFSNYTKVSSVSRTIYSDHCTITNTYDCSTLKNYKAEVTVTATTASGQKETITVSQEY